jgi:rod shape-determining protein MreC
VKKRLTFTFSFFVCLVISLLLFFARETPMVQYISNKAEFLISPIRNTSYSVALSFPWMAKSREEKLRDEILELKKKLASQELLQKDILALKDQFAVSTDDSTTLLPARVVGAPRLIPNSLLPELLVIDKGKKDGVVLGLGVIARDTAVGKVTKVSESHAVVQLITSKSFSLPVKTTRSGALGVINGRGNEEMVLDKVLLSEDIAIGDMVATYADLDDAGLGFRPGFIIGQITSIDKQPSAIFQKGSVKTLVDVTRLPFVFVIMP